MSALTSPYFFEHIRPEGQPVKCDSEAAGASALCGVGCPFLDKSFVWQAGGVGKKRRAVCWYLQLNVSTFNDIAAAFFDFYPPRVLLYIF